MTTISHQRRWQNEFANVAAAVRPYVRTIAGSQYVSTDCPRWLAKTYAGLVQVGYANGWVN